ncbi:hypothetical protein BDZ89DRAFT_1060341 [Hymenopellis radicata]|nr:hypothetical protein BDZ89DRAFT_1060341 [Hymenopellis radicata]
MYPTADEKAVVDAAEALMVKTMARYDPSHDRYHVQRVRKTALALANALPTMPDLLVVELAALLHDVLDKKYVSTELAADPYASVDIIKDGRARQITQIIDNVSWSTEKKRRASGEWGQWHDECIELHCVQDADRLDAIGAFGVMRCAAYTSSTNNPLHTPPKDPLLPVSAVQHFSDKLIHIHERLKTEPGRIMGQKRHKLILDFMDAISDEANCIIEN